MQSDRPVLLVALIALMSSVVPILAMAQDGFATNTRLGLFADPEGTQPCISIPQGEVGRIYLVATTAGQSAAGFQGAEFRIEVSNAAGYVFTYEPPEASNIALGNPIDTDPDSDNEAGANVAFPECQSLTGQAGDRIDMGSLLVVNLTGGPARLQVKKRSPPSNANYQFPILNLCNAPAFNATPMGACTSGPTGEVVSSEAFLNDGSCGVEGPCAADCDPAPSIRVVGRQVPQFVCPGETVTLETVAWNTGSAPQSIAFFVDGQPADAFNDVAPGDSVKVQRSYAVEECGFVASHMFGVVAETDSCPRPVGRELLLAARCSPSQCDDGSEGCAYVSLLKPSEVPAGEEFSVTIRVGEHDLLRRARNVFGVSGRLRYERPDLLEFVGLVCEDVNGQPLSMGPDAICFATANPSTGFVDFAVTRKAGDAGLWGSLTVARAIFRFPEEVGGGFCSAMSLDDVRIINPYGESLCYVEGFYGQRTCSISPCRVWPGDANRDGQVDALDLQTMAGFWGVEGPPRKWESCYWEPGISIPPRPGNVVDCWPDYDAAWSDAFGDGRVGPEDVLCVGMNWGRSYESPFDPIPGEAGNSLLRMQAYEQMLQYMDGMSDSEEGVVEARQALQELLDSVPAPTVAALMQNVPNPFNPQTTIRYTMASVGHARIEVFDVTGKLVRTLVDEQKGPGEHAVIWDGTRDSGAEVASGIYYTRATLGDETFARKMVLAR